MAVSRIGWIGVLLLCTGAAGNARPGLLKDQTLAVDGSERSYDLYIPATGTAGSYPVVLLLHGHLGNADVMTGENRKAAPYKVWLEIAERERLLLIIPDGERGADGYRGWNDCRADATILPHTDDVAFIDRLIETVAAKYPIDRTRVYATGTSNGGDMVSSVSFRPVGNRCRRRAWGKNDYGQLEAKMQLYSERQTGT